MVTPTLIDTGLLETYPIALVVIIVILIPLIIKFIERSFSQFWDSIFKRKKEYIWNETVLRNKTIKQSFDEYKNIGSNNKYWILFLYIGTIVGLLTSVSLTIIGLFVASKLIGIPYLSHILNIDQVLSFMIPLLMLLSIFLLIKVTNKLNNKNNMVAKEYLINNYNKLLNQSLAIASYIATFFMFYIFSFFIIFKIRSNIDDYLHFSIMLFVFVGFLLVFVLYYLFLTMRSYRHNIKNYLNSKYSKKYPYVHVSTIGGNQSFGQVKDIFNSKYLILNNKGIEEIILWSSIDLLKIQEYKITDNNAQKSIFDY